MADLKQQVAEIMERIRGAGLPQPQEIVNQAFKELGFIKGKLSKEYVRDNFDEIMEKVWLKTAEILENYERKVYSVGIPSELNKLFPQEIQQAEELSKDKGFVEGFKFFFEQLFPYLREMFLSISQSRKMRGGRDFELQFERLLDLAEIPFEKYRRIYRVDFMIPSNEAFQRDPTTAIIASVKRTLRERWKEVVDELLALRCPNTFIVTANNQISPEKVRKICYDYRLHLVVWASYKRQNFDQEPLVLSYTQWFKEKVLALEQFWK